MEIFDYSIILNINLLWTLPKHMPFVESMR